MTIYESDYCVVDTSVWGRSDEKWYIGGAYDGYEAASWPTKEAMIADLEAAVAALRAQT